MSNIYVEKEVSIKIHRTHNLSKSSITEIVEDIASDLSEALNIRYQWEGDRLVFKRLGVSGYIEVEGQAVTVYINKSPLLPISDAQIRRHVEEKMDEHFK